MKKGVNITLTILISWAICLTFLLYGCKKENEPQPTGKSVVPTPQSCAVDNVKDVLWISGTSNLYADLKFNSSGVMYEEGKPDGTWTVITCDSVHVVNSNNYYLKIISITSDTLKLRWAFIGVVTYHK